MMFMHTVRSWSTVVSKCSAFIKVTSQITQISFTHNPHRYACFQQRAFLKTMKLDTPEFHSLFTPELEKLVQLFKKNSYEIRIAGGAVRDLLMGIRPSDLDFATTATPQQMQTMFDSEGIRTFNNKGEKHGTVTCRINDKENFEVTTLRIDVETDGRHAEVQFTMDWQLDSERRDLTINSMFLDLDGTLYDYFGGQEDLLDRKVRFVGSAATRIQEDYLRILRYFRFYGRIATDPNGHQEETLRAIRQNVSGLEGISGERIWVELKKILKGQHVVEIMRVMFELGVNRYMGLPGNGNFQEFDRVWKGCADLFPLPMTLLPALLSSDEQVLMLHKRVKMSKDELNLGLFITQHRHDDLGDKPVNYFQDLICDTAGNLDKTREKVNELVKYLNQRNVLEELRGWAPPKFPVNGMRLADMGVPKGRQLAEVLGFLRGKWKESRYSLGEDELLLFVDEARKKCAVK